MSYKTSTKKLKYFDVQRGFTIIEFMVASILAMLVLLAIGVTYGTTNRAKQTPEGRLAAQQDLRNAAEMIVRDARMAGSFGCFNMGNLISKQFSGFTLSNHFSLSLNDSLASGVGVLDHTNAAVQNAFKAGNPNFILSSDPLVFTYGINPEVIQVNGGVASVSSTSEAAKWSQAGGNVAVASCLNMEINGVTIDTAGNLQHTNSPFVSNENTRTVFYAPQTMVSQVYSVAYATGRISTVDTVNGLYRSNLNTDGSWGSPQLMVADINGAMQVNSIYAGCAIDDTASTYNQDRQVLETSGFARISVMPVLLELRFGMNDSNNINKHGVVEDYMIRANVRGGNVCAGQ